MLKNLILVGYKSVASLSLPLGPLNILVGANGAGKSNILSVFGLLNRLTGKAFVDFVNRAGGASSLLHLGPKKTLEMSFELAFESDKGSNIYRAAFTHGAQDALFFVEEKVGYAPADPSQTAEWFYTAAETESRLPDVIEHGGPSEPLKQFITDQLDRWRLYHFHDTSPEARARQAADLHHDRYLHADAGNLATFLLVLRQNHPLHFREVVENVRLAFPSFMDC